MNTSRLLPLFVLISFVLVVAILYKKSNSTGDVTQPNIIKKNTAIVEDEVNENYVEERPYKYDIISKRNIGSVVNIDFVTNKLDFTKSEIETIAVELKKKYCSEENCNVISLWKNLDTYNLYKNQKTTNEDYAWMKKNWVHICENLVFDYNVFVDEILIYPFLDSKYNKYGGKMKRPR